MAKQFVVVPKRFQNLSVQPKSTLNQPSNAAQQKAFDEAYQLYMQHRQLMERLADR